MFMIRREYAFGDVMMGALASDNLVANGVDAGFWPSLHAQLLDCKFIPDFNGTEVWFEYESCREQVGVSYIEAWMNRFSQKYLDGRPMQLLIKTVPVKFTEVPETPYYDVVLNTNTGPHTPYRKWPYFEKLKQYLHGRGVTFLDLNEHEIRDNDCLNHVHKAGLYVGLETGMSHYVSRVAAGKALIIQSGFTKAHQWCVYDYEILERPTHCGPCFLTEGCKYNHECMIHISAEIVLARILDRLGHPPI